MYAPFVAEAFSAPSDRFLAPGLDTFDFYISEGATEDLDMYYAKPATTVFHGDWNSNTRFWDNGAHFSQYFNLTYPTSTDYPVHHGSHIQGGFQHRSRERTGFQGADLYMPLHEHEDHYATSCGAAGQGYGSGALGVAGLQIALREDMAVPGSPDSTHSTENNFAASYPNTSGGAPTYEELSTATERRYRCTECGHETTRLGDMKRHHESLRHSEPRYACRCGKRFSRKDSLTRHWKKCTGGQLFC